ncbi:NYN domain-containing protein [Demetria terragena]|uniref:NYN domain-containing protein n=1 Tax=Demetria terragena TaxID=63959 RepID=UPI00035FE056|nr:NYN domain-containing protein [Demetria terragena]
MSDATAPQRQTYVLVDGENIDATLGTSILSRRPLPEERPRWDRVLTYAESEWEQPVTGLFFLAASHGEMPMSFVQALTAMGYQPVPLAGGPGEKVVDIAIQRTLSALVDRPADVMLLSHDGDFLPQLSALVTDDHDVALVGFKEFRNAGFAELEESGLQFHDLEYDVGAFNARLPRLRIIPIEEFDPLDFL